MLDAAAACSEQTDDLLTFHLPAWPHLRDELGYVVVAVMHGHFLYKIPTLGGILVHSPEIYHLSFIGYQCSELHP